MIEAEYALETKPVRDRMAALFTENKNVTTGELAEQLHVERLSASSDSCPPLISLTEEVKRYSIPVDLPRGWFMDTESYRFLFQTSSGAIEVSYQGPFPDGEPHSYLIGWFDRVRNVLQGPCSGTAVPHE